MAKEYKGSDLLSLVTVFGTTASMVVTIIYGTWFISTIEKRISLLEQNNLNFSEKIQGFKTDQDSANDSQDKSQLRFQDAVNNQMARMEDKIEKMYVTLASEKRYRGEG